MADGEEEKGGTELNPMLLVEAALFSAARPVSEEELSGSTGIEKGLVKLYVKKLMNRYRRMDSSLEVIKAGRKYSLQLRREYVKGVSKLAAPEVPQKVLKTAALIAYHQPVKQSELVDMYGAKVYDHVKELHDLGLIRTRRDGSTKVITTTQRFAESFGIDGVTKKRIRQFIRKHALFGSKEGATLMDFETSDEEEPDPPEDGRDEEEGPEESPEGDPEGEDDPVSRDDT